MIPHPTEKPLFLDVKHPDFITDSNVPRSPLVYRGFRLHKVLLATEDSRVTQVVVPHLNGEDTHWMITYQKAQTIPEYHSAGTINVPLAVACDNHWNILKDPVFPACLVAFRERHEASKVTTPKEGLPTTGVILSTTLTSATSSLFSNSSHL